jgi:hypothetical protein
VTVAVSGVLGFDAGNGCSTAYAPPLSAGVRVPYARVYRVVLFARGTSLRPRMRR